MKRRKWFIIGIVVIAMVVASVTVGPAAEKRPYKIGCIFSYTGVAAFLGDRMKTTVEMMAEAVNKNGGIDGHRVELFIYDSGSEVTKAVTAATRLITQDKVDIISGAGNMSGLSLAIKPIANRYKTPMISNAGSRSIVEPVEESHWVFKSHLTDKEIIGRAFDWWKSKGITKVAMLSSTSGFGKSARAELERQEPGSGVKVVAWEEFDNKTTDMTPQLTRIRSANPEVILYWTVAPAGVVIMKNARQLGMKQILMTGFGYVVPRYMKMAGEAAEGCVLVSLRYPVGPQLADMDPTKKIILAYMEEHKAKYGFYPDVYGSEAYDGMLMAFEALRIAKSLEKEKLRSALEKLDFIGTNGVYKFSPKRHYGLTTKDAVVFEWRNGGWNLLMAAETK
jgi:branched-chain amino acid transport system substrate-binding protein